MDYDKLGGSLFVGTTVLLAFLDGVLIPMIIAGGGSVLLYKYICKLMDRAPEAIYNQKENEYRKTLLAIKDKGQREKFSKQMSKDLEELARIRTMDDNARKEAAKLIGIGAFIFPIAGLAAAAAACAISRDERVLIKK